MRDDGFTDFTLPPNIKPCKNHHVLAGQIFTMEGEINKSLSHHETLLAWTGFLSKAPSDKVVICQPNNNEVALMGELSAETLKLRNIKGYIADGGCRDVTRIKNEIKFPVYCKFNTPKDIAGRWLVKTMGEKISIDNVIINSGDYLIADEDGIVITFAGEIGCEFERFSAISFSGS